MGGAHLNAMQQLGGFGSMMGGGNFSAHRSAQPHIKISVCLDADQITPEIRRILSESQIFVNRGCSNSN